MFTSDDPRERAQQCREQAYQCDDPGVAEFLRRMADDYETLANYADKQREVKTKPESLDPS
jgi:hypothetical protein